MLTPESIESRLQAAVQALHPNERIKQIDENHRGTFFQIGQLFPRVLRVFPGGRAAPQAGEGVGGGGGGDQPPPNSTG